MKLRTFTAPDTTTAMQLVRKALGDDAIILSTKESVNGVPCITVTAAIDNDAPQIEKLNPTVLSTEQSTPDTDNLRFEIQNVLRFHNLPELFITKLMQKATNQSLASIVALHRISGNKNARDLQHMALEKILAAFFGFEALPLEHQNVRLMLVGPPGAGKTLTIAKMAARLSMDGQKLTVITTDNKRAGGIEQLEAFTRILGLELKVATSKKELTHHLESAYPRTIIDTAGCNPFDHQESLELQEYASLPGIEPVLALPAGGDALEVIDAVETFAMLPIRRLLVTRTDTARRFGGILAAAATHNLALSNTSHSPSIMDTLPAIEPGMLAKLLLRYQVKPVPATLMVSHAQQK